MTRTHDFLDFRTCPECKESKRLSEDKSETGFYIKGRRTNGEPRWDRICIYCRCLAQKKVDQECENELRVEPTKAEEFTKAKLTNEEFGCVVDVFKLLARVRDRVREESHCNGRT